MYNGKKIWLSNIDISKHPREYNCDACLCVQTSYKIKFEDKHDH